MYYLEGENLEEGGGARVQMFNPNKYFWLFPRPYSTESPDIKASKFIT